VQRRELSHAQMHLAAPRVLTNLEAWIRRRLRSYLWRQWQNGPNRFKELRRRGVPKFNAAVAAGSPTGFWCSGACPDTRRSNKPCATTISIHSVSPDSMSLPKLNPVEPPWYGPVCPVVWELRLVSAWNSVACDGDRGKA
jgi:hypothetical protein